MSTIPYFDVWGRGGSPILLIHGFMMHGEMFYPQIEELSRTHLVIVPDLRGYGNSQHLPGPYSIEQHAEDMHYILQSIGNPKVHLIGFSLGGLVAQVFVRRYSLSVRSLVLSNTFSYKSMTALERIQRVLAPSVIAKVAKVGIGSLVPPILADWVGKLDADTYRWYLNMMKRNRNDVVLESIRDLFRFDSRGWLNEIRQPSLVVGASHDLIVPLAHAYFLSRNLPNAQIKVIDGAGHASMHTHAAEFQKSLIQFLNQVDR